MKRTQIRFFAKTAALILAGVTCLGGLDTNATKADKVIEIPENSEIGYYKDSLQLASYTVYDYTENGSGRHSYLGTGELYYSKDELIYEEDGYKVKKIYEVRPAGTYAEAFLYTYRYLEDKTLCYMDKYDHGNYEYGKGWVWDAEGREVLAAKYDAEGNVKSIDCSYYDEEGRLAYEFSDLSGLEERIIDAAPMRSYEYSGDYTAYGYTQEWVNGEKQLCYRKDEKDGKVLLEVECADELDNLCWYSYDEEGKMLFEIAVRPESGEMYYEVELTHYLYDEQGRIKESYSYDVVDDLIIQDEGLYSGTYRHFAVLYGERGFPTDLIVESGEAEPVVVVFDLDDGTVVNMDMGEN